MRANPAPQPDDLAVAFFTSFARTRPAIRLAVRGQAIALVAPDDADAGDIAAVFFDRWRDAHPDARLEDVPADLVMASGSGLDPHITLANARFQLPRVAGAWAKQTGREPVELQAETATLLEQHASAPLFGLAGVALVNVVEVNVALHRRYGAATSP